MDEAGKDRLRTAITARGLALTDVAYACGISRPAVAQWFTDKPSRRPIPERHMATIRELLTEPGAPVPSPHVLAARSRPERDEPQRQRPAKTARSAPEPQLGMPQPLAVPARRRSTPQRWDPAATLSRWEGGSPAPRAPIHYPGHWAPPPVMPPLAPAYVSPAGPRHSDMVAAHNHASRQGVHRDVRSPASAPPAPGSGEFPLGRFFGLTGPIRREDVEAFEAQLTLYAVENGFAGEPELQRVIEALRAAVRSHNQKFGNQ